MSSAQGDPVLAQMLGGAAQQFGGPGTYGSLPLTPFNVSGMNFLNRQLHNVDMREQMKDAGEATIGQAMHWNTGSGARLKQLAKTPEGAKWIKENFDKPASVLWGNTKPTPQPGTPEHLDIISRTYPVDIMALLAAGLGPAAQAIPQKYRPTPSLLGGGGGGDPYASMGGVDSYLAGGG